MQRNEIVKGVFIFVPLTVLCLLYGLWLVLDTPLYLESMLAGGVALLLFSLLFLYFVPQAFDYVLDADRERLPALVQRTSTVSAREILRLVFLLIIARGVIMVGAFLWSLYLNGYTETVFEIQHIWADHLYAGRIISLANKGYRVEATGYEGMYLNLLYPPFYSLIVRLISPFYLSSIRAGFFVSNLNVILSGIVLYLLVLHDSDRRSAVRALWYFCVFPPGVLLTCTIPASTFMLLSLLSIYCARRRWFVAGAVFGSMAALTDRIGIVLVVPLLLEFFNAMTGEYRLLTEVTWRFYLKKGIIGASFILVPLGFIAYLIINQVVGGSLFAYAEYREALYGSSFALFHRVIGQLTEGMIDAYRTFDMADLFGVYAPNLLFGLGSLALVLGVRKQMRTSYLAYFLICFAAIFSQTGLIDGPRQLFCCFPVILAMVYVTKSKLADLLLSLLCIAGLVAYMGMYVAGWPVA